MIRLNLMAVAHLDRAVKSVQFDGSAMGLDSVELVMSAEEHFGIEIPDRIAEQLPTVGSLHNYIVAELQRIEKPRDAEVVFAELREIICEQLGVKPERVVPEARFVQDLKID